MDPDRYEPLPGLLELPAWLWRRTPRAARIALTAAAVAAIALAVALVPRISDTKEERAATERREAAAARERRIRDLNAEQRPRFGRSQAAAPRSLTARRRVMRDLTTAIEADAKRRVASGDLDGRVRRVECEPFPRTVDAVPPHRDPTKSEGRYACVAVTSEFGGGVIGHPYRTLVAFDTGRFAYCKTTGVTGPEREQLVTVPRACGGR